MCIRDSLLIEVCTYDNKQYVSVPAICAAIGIAANKQELRLQSNPQFNPDHMVGMGLDGKARQLLALPLEEVGMWLCSINARKVKESIRDILIQFQKHCQVELHAAIMGQAGIARVAALESQVDTLTTLMEGISKQLNTVLEENALLKQTNEAMWKSRRFEATSASYGMHSAKARKTAVENF